MFAGQGGARQDRAGDPQVQSPPILVMKEEVVGEGETSGGEGASAKWWWLRKMRVMVVGVYIRDG